METSRASLGVRTNQFGFNTTGTSKIVVVVEASTNLANPVWLPLATNTLTGGSAYFSLHINTPIILTFTFFRGDLRTSLMRKERESG